MLSCLTCQWKDSIFHLWPDLDIPDCHDLIAFLSLFKPDRIPSYSMPLYEKLYGGREGIAECIKAKRKLSSKIWKLLKGTLKKFKGIVYDKLMAKIRSFIKFILVTSQIFYPLEILMVQHIPNITYLLMLFSYLLGPPSSPFQK